MRKAFAVLLAMAAGQWAASTAVAGHGFGSTITWNREVSRLVYDRCASCHRPGGEAFSLMTYLDIQPRANAVKDAVLARRMPPWGAVKGFGHFRDDQSLSQEQIELVTRWVDTGMRRGNNPRMLPPPPTFPPAPPAQAPVATVRVQGPFTVRDGFTLDGIVPLHVPQGRSMQIVAVLPGGRVEPLVWLKDFDPRYAHPFLLRRPLTLPASTEIRGVPPDATIGLIPTS
jgi:hypothetical protein